MNSPKRQGSGQVRPPRPRAPRPAPPLRRRAPPALDALGRRSSRPERADPRRRRPHREGDRRGARPPGGHVCGAPGRHRRVGADRPLPRGAWCPPAYRRVLSSRGGAALPHAVLAEELQQAPQRGLRVVVDDDPGASDGIRAAANAGAPAAVLPMASPSRYASSSNSSTRGSTEGESAGRRPAFASHAPWASGPVAGTPASNSVDRAVARCAVPRSLRPYPSPPRK